VELGEDLITWVCLELNARALVSSWKVENLDDLNVGWLGVLSHPVLEGKPNANHVRARISYSRTQQLHNMDIITQCSK
jgi:hypothetical protein